jgi:tetratricopeptide (TPR) repeat protein
MRVQSMLLGTALNGPLPVPAAIRRCEDMLAKYADRQRVVVSALRALVPLKAMATEFDEAHELAERAKTMCDELGLTVVAVEAADAYRLAWMLEGDPAEAERELRVAEGILAGLGVTTSTSTLLGGLADAVCAQGRYDEALELARKAERLASSDDVITQMEWRMPCARALAHRGTADEAERLAREAVEVGETTDFLNVHADALLTLAEVLTVVGRDGAESARAQALELYERKGNVAALAQLRESLPR